MAPRRLKFKYCELLSAYILTTNQLYFKSNSNKNFKKWGVTGICCFCCSETTYIFISVSLFKILDIHLKLI